MGTGTPPPADEEAAAELGRVLMTVAWLVLVVEVLVLTVELEREEAEAGGAVDLELLAGGWGLAVEFTGL